MEWGGFPPKLHEPSAATDVDVVDQQLRAALRPVEKESERGAAPRRARVHPQSHGSNLSKAPDQNEGKVDIGSQMLTGKRNLRLRVQLRVDAAGESAESGTNAPRFARFPTNQIYTAQDGSASERRNLRSVLVAEATRNVEARTENNRKHIRPSERSACAAPVALGTTGGQQETSRRMKTGNLVADAVAATDALDGSQGTKNKRGSRKKTQRPRRKVVGRKHMPTRARIERHTRTTDSERQRPNRDKDRDETKIETRP